MKTVPVPAEASFINSGPGLIRGPTGASMEHTKHLQGATDNYRLLFSLKFEVGEKGTQQAERALMFEKAFQS